MMVWCPVYTKRETAVATANCFFRYAHEHQFLRSEFSLFYTYYRKAKQLHCLAKFYVYWINYHSLDIRIDYFAEDNFIVLCSFIPHVGEVQ